MAGYQSRSLLLAFSWTDAKLRYIETQKRNERYWSIKTKNDLSIFESWERKSTFMACFGFFISHIEKILI